jgi:hypothetical protein
VHSRKRSEIIDSKTLSLRPPRYIETTYWGYILKSLVFQADLTTEAYEAHQQSINAPKPLSAREEAMQSIRAAEKAAGLNSYQGSNERRSHTGSAPVGFKWASDAEDAVKDLANQEGCSKLVILVRK